MIIRPSSNYMDAIKGIKTALIGIAVVMPMTTIWCGCALLIFKILFACQAGLPISHAIRYITHPEMITLYLSAWVAFCFLLIPACLALVNRENLNRKLDLYYQAYDGTQKLSGAVSLSKLIRRLVDMILSLREIRVSLVSYVTTLVLMSVVMFYIFSFFVPSLLDASTHIAHPHID